MPPLQNHHERTAITVSSSQASLENGNLEKVNANDLGSAIIISSSSCCSVAPSLDSSSLEPVEDRISKLQRALDLCEHTPLWNACRFTLQNDVSLLLQQAREETNGCAVSTHCASLAHAKVGRYLDALEAILSSSSNETKQLWMNSLPPNAVLRSVSLSLSSRPTLDIRLGTPARIERPPRFQVQVDPIVTLKMMDYAGHSALEPCQVQVLSCLHDDHVAAFHHSRSLLQASIVGRLRMTLRVSPTGGSSKTNKKIAGGLWVDHARVVQRNAHPVQPPSTHMDDLYRSTTFGDPSCTVTFSVWTFATRNDTPMLQVDLVLDSKEPQTA